jgi:release factor glutamine methyltransferase
MNITELAQHIIDELSPLLGPGEATSVSRLVLEDLFGYRRGSHPRQLSQDEQIMAWATINRLKAGEPVQYVTGIADFYGLQLKVSPAVLIPRPETEELVEWILEDHVAGPQVQCLDIGTGSGCISLALKHKRPTWTCTGVDVSEEALEVARANAEKLGLTVRFAAVDVLANEDDFKFLPKPIKDTLTPPTSEPSPLSGGEGPGERATINILISNPPYIPPSEREVMSPSTLAHEPELALFVLEEDPLLFYRRIAELGLEALAEGGQLYFETNEFNNESVVSVLEELGYTDVERRKDLQGKWRMVRGTR